MHTHRNDLSIDVKNMGKWGIRFEDPEAPRFESVVTDPVPKFKHPVTSPIENVLAYIDFFGRYEWDSDNNAPFYPGMETPLFWATWRSLAYGLQNRDYVTTVVKG